MKTQILLDRAEEIAALFGEGFVLKLANGEEITIKADEQTIRSAPTFRFSSEAIGAIDQSPVPASNGHAASTNGAQSEAAEKKKQRAPRAPRKAADNGNCLDLFPCRFCDETFKRAAGRGRHESAAHPDEFKPKRQTASDLKCPHGDCDYSTKKAGWLSNHIDREHGGRSIAVGM